MRYLVVLMAGMSIYHAQADNGSEYQRTAKAKELVQKRLKNPDSAKFKELHLDTFPSGGIIVCGEVDSKNGNGRYTGFRRFYSTGVTARFKEDEPKIFDDVYTMICSK
ncbi:hypothetical protein ACAW49_05945 [Pseudomonas sp. Env-44]|jgi:hypothetical protein|uniref:hypothetical protein n=1 Tax=Pseudomonas TaxID=286 RepID=UPI000CD47B16|nr:MULTISPECIES: hypothetical protein [Pseudomonas]MBJ2236068.1 hypothetical protein [Pseudomonas fluorescens]MBK3442898.1 hypothetical protein [Pseudomonas lactis]POH42550.1 hypothetical protein C2U56_05095 [Pseudomonas fluorescens]